MGEKTYKNIFSNQSAAIDVPRISNAKEENYCNEIFKLINNGELAPYKITSQIFLNKIVSKSDDLHGCDPENIRRRVTSKMNAHFPRYPERNQYATSILLRKFFEEKLFFNEKEYANNLKDVINCFEGRGKAYLERLVRLRMHERSMLFFGSRTPTASSLTNFLMNNARDIIAEVDNACSKDLIGNIWSANKLLGDMLGIMYACATGDTNVSRRNAVQSLIRDASNLNGVKLEFSSVEIDALAYRFTCDSPGLIEFFRATDDQARARDQPRRLPPNSNTTITFVAQSNQSHARLNIRPGGTAIVRNDRDPITSSVNSPQGQVSTQRLNVPSCPSASTLESSPGELSISLKRTLDAKAQGATMGPLTTALPSISAEIPAQKRLRKLDS
jgi:hypothetical protein